MKNLYKKSNNDLIIEHSNGEINKPSVNFDGNGVIYVKESGALSGVALDGIVSKVFGEYEMRKGKKTNIYPINTPNIINDYSSSANNKTCGYLLDNDTHIVIELEDGYGEGVFSVNIAPRIGEGEIAVKINGEVFVYNATENYNLQHIFSKLIKDTHNIVVEGVEGYDNTILMSMSWLPKNKKLAFSFAKANNYYTICFPYNIKNISQYDLKIRTLEVKSIENGRVNTFDYKYVNNVIAGHSYIISSDIIQDAYFDFDGDAVLEPISEECLIGKYSYDYMVLYKNNEYGNNGIGGFTGDGCRPAGSGATIGSFKALVDARS